MDVPTEIANIERELLALAANQAPAPRQISTFVRTVNITGPNDTITVTFPQGVKLFQAYSGNGQSEWTVSISGNVVTFNIYTTDTTFTVVSLSEFSIA